ncbi:bacitracin ABC transporter ATP-binding protein [Neobacillus sp. NPDC058068]
MSTQKKPILTDEFLDELAKEISQLYGGPEYENSDMQVKQDN